MLAAKRHREIVSYVEKQGSAKVTELAGMFDVTKETIRRDLERLEQDGKLLRRRGGAINVASLYHETPFSEREIQNVQQKVSIAAEAIKRIDPGDTIILDASTTAWQMARQMPDIQITVITNAIKVVMELAGRPHITCICLGGNLSSESLSFIGPISERNIRDYHVDKLFLSCKGADPVRGCSDSNEWQAMLKRQMMETANQHILLADHSKFDVKALSVFAALADFEEIITDWEASEELLKRLRSKSSIVSIARRKP